MQIFCDAMSWTLEVSEISRYNAAKRKGRVGLGRNWQPDPCREVLYSSTYIPSQ